MVYVFFCAIIAFNKITCEDIDVLVEFFDATNGSSWLRNNNWLTNESISTWYGITTNTVGNVIEIWLPMNNLTGTIPQALGNLTDLQRLNFDGYCRAVDRMIEGNIPSSLSRLINLEYISIRCQLLSGPLPSLTDVVNLDYIDVSSNHLTGSFSECMTMMPMVSHLLLGSNSFTGTIPESISRFTNLTHLNLSANLLTGEPSSLSTSEQIVQLDLHQNYFYGQIFDITKNFDKMDTLIVSGNQFDGMIQSSSLRNLTSLQTLDLQENQLSGAFPSSISLLGKLEFLSFSTNQFVGTLPEVFGELGNLVYLKIAGNSLSGRLPTSIFDIKNLQELDVGGNLLSGTISSDIGKLVQLIRLSLHSNSFTGTIPLTFQNLVKIRDVLLYSNDFEGQIFHLFENAPRVDVFRIYENQFTGNIYIANDATQDLVIYSNLFTGTIPESLVEQSNLRYLYLYDNLFEGSVPPMYVRYRYKIQNNYFTGKFNLNASYTMDALQTSDNYFSGTLSQALFNLPLLISLYIDGNFLSGSLPSDLSYFSTLVDFNASFNMFTGTIPNIVSNSLLNLEIYSNNFTGKSQINEINVY